MSQIGKLVVRFLCRAKDLTRKGLILRFYGYEALPREKTGGSRVKFSDQRKRIISLRKPHPTPIVKLYVIEQIISTLKENGQIKND